MALTAAPAAPRRKVIIDTDPGVDDSFAILLALRSPEIEVIGLTSLFGNVRTPTATKTRCTCWSGSGGATSRCTRAI